MPLKKRNYVMRFILAGIASLLSAATALADMPESTFVLAGRMIDVERGRVIQDQAIEIIDGKIVSIGPVERSYLDTATIIDLSSSTVLPGLMDGHVHLTADAGAHGYARLGLSRADSTIKGVVNAEKTLLAGFTTVRNVGSDGGFPDVALRKAVDAGDIVGPRIIAAGPSIGITGGHCDNNLLPPEYDRRASGVGDGPWEVRELVRRNVKYGADVIKFCGTGGVLSKGTRIGAQQFTEEEMAALIDEAHMLGLKVAVHAHGPEGIKSALRAGVDSVEHASLIDEEGIRLAKRNGAYLSMDIYVSDYILAEGERIGILAESLEKERQVGARQRSSFQRAHDAGVKMSFGSDAGVYPHGENARQFAFMVKHGMTPMEAIQTATVNTADLFGISEIAGAIAVGRAADIIAVEGDPLADVSALEAVCFVMKGGRVFKEACNAD